MWLEQYLAEYKKCLILVSHSQDFLNGVCTHMIWLTQSRLTCVRVFFCCGCCLLLGLLAAAC